MMERLNPQESSSPAKDRSEFYAHRELIGTAEAGVSDPVQQILDKHKALFIRGQLNEGPVRALLREELQALQAVDADDEEIAQALEQKFRGIAGHRLH